MREDEGAPVWPSTTQCHGALGKALVTVFGNHWRSQCRGYVRACRIESRLLRSRISLLVSLVVVYSKHERQSVSSLPYICQRRASLPLQTALIDPTRARHHRSEARQVEERNQPLTPDGRSQGPRSSQMEQSPLLPTLLSGHTPACACPEKHHRAQGNHMYCGINHPSSTAIGLAHAGTEELGLWLTFPTPILHNAYPMQFSPHSLFKVEIRRCVSRLLP